MLPGHGKSQKKVTKRRGSLLVDALLAIAIFGAIVAAFSTAVSDGQQGAVRGGNQVRAAYLAQEGLEVIRSIRDSSTETGFSTITARALNQDDGINIVSGDWAIVDNATTIDTIFTRAIRFTNPNNSDNERLVTSTVTWTNPGSSKTNSIVLSMYITNWRAEPPPPPPDWSQPILISAFNDPAFDPPKLEKIQVSGNYAYIAATGNTDPPTVFIVDISNPSSPSLVNSIDLGSVDAYDIAVQGNYLYVGTSDSLGELRIIDITTPASAICCLRTIDLAGTQLIYALSIAGERLFVARTADISGPELYAFDINSDPGLSTVSSPPLLGGAVDLIYESDPDTRAMFAVTATGYLASAMNSVYIASDQTTGELSVIDVPSSALSGGKDTGEHTRGTAVAIYNTGSFIGVIGGGGLNTAYEVFSYSIAGTIGNPSDAGSQYDLLGDFDATESVQDMAVSKSLGYLFMATNTTRSGVRHYLHVLDVSNVRDISRASGRHVYDGDITDSHTGENGIYYRESDHTLFMVGGDQWEASELLILRPTYSYE